MGRKNEGKGEAEPAKRKFVLEVFATYTEVSSWASFTLHNEGFKTTTEQQFREV